MKNQFDLPMEWCDVSHYDLRIAWLRNQPRDSAGVFSQETEKKQTEVNGYPGWWMYYNVLVDIAGDSLEEALALAKSTLKHSDLKPGLFNVGLTSSLQLPVRLSKSQRIKLIDQIMHEPKRELEEGLVREAFLRVGDFALAVWIEDIPYPEEFEAVFSAPENPLRSLEGEICVVYASALDEDFDDEDFDDEDFEDFDEDFDDEDMEDLSEEGVKEFRDYVEALQEGETPELPSTNLDELEDLNNLDDLEDEDFDDGDFDEGTQDEAWQEIAKGTLRFEGNIVHVGDWQCTVPESEFVFGRAFLKASFDLEETKQIILIEKENLNE